MFDFYPGLPHTCTCMYVSNFLTGDLVPVVLHQFLDVEEEISEKRGTLPFKEVFGRHHNWNDVLHHIALHNLQRKTLKVIVATVSSA